MVPPFDKYITLFLQSSVSTFTRIKAMRKSNIYYQSFFVKHVDIIRPLKAVIFSIDYMYMTRLYLSNITSINLLFKSKVFRKTYLNVQAVITLVFITYVCEFSEKK